ncbi:MAG TPA: HAD-IC family P-type ATPase [Marmoricola sp.]|nr:HAD-IC family P-type ATPase [Marmoricola sp.]
MALISTSGLSDAEVAERIAAGLVNATTTAVGRTNLDIIRANVFTRINAILATLLAFVIATGSWTNGAFGLLIVFNSIIGIIQEIRAKRTLDSLTIVSAARPKVRRNGAIAEISADQLVLDDIVLCAPGDQIMVDGELVECSQLEVDESLLTGEADPIEKQVGAEVRSGSFVVAGNGAYRATGIGDEAYAAKLAQQAGRFTLVNSELRNGINTILKVVTFLLIPAGVLTIINQVLSAQHSDWRHALLGMVGALVPMVPEGLVLLTSMAFAVGVVRLGRHNCLINELPAIEGLARVSVVCADKTGTLTEPGMRLINVDQLGDQPVADALAALAVADPNPNPTMQAIAEQYSTDPGWTVGAVQPFSSARKWSGVSFVGNGNWLVGAPDVLVSGDSPTARKATKLGAQGNRIILVATSECPVDHPDALCSVTPQALLVLEQRIRPDAQETIEYFHREGVNVKVISGDNAVSVGAVVSELGLGAVEDAVDARELPETETEFADVIETSQVFGRVSPDQKRAMVHALQGRGETVAMTGDGVNDVLALKDADIGVAMGSGSPASRAVAQIVLLDNRFASLPHVVAEGRRVIGNIERVSNLFLTKTIYAVLLALLIGISGLASKAFGITEISYPFQPIHVTITAWFTVGIPAFILSLAPNPERAQSGFVRRVLRLAIPSGIVIALCTFACYLIVRPGMNAGTGDSGSAVGVTMDVQHIQAATAALATLILIAWWVLVIIARPLNHWRLALLAVSIAAYVPIFTLPMAQRLFRLDPGATDKMMVALVCGVIGMVLVEVLHRLLANRK